MSLYTVEQLIADLSVIPNPETVRFPYKVSKIGTLSFKGKVKHVFQEDAVNPNVAVLMPTTKSVSVKEILVTLREITAKHSGLVAVAMNVPRATYETFIPPKMFVRLARSRLSLSETDIGESHDIKLLVEKLNERRGQPLSRLLADLPELEVNCHLGTAIYLVGDEWYYQKSLERQFPALLKCSTWKQLFKLEASTARVTVYICKVPLAVMRQEFVPVSDRVAHLAEVYDKPPALPTLIPGPVSTAMPGLKSGRERTAAELKLTCYADDNIFVPISDEPGENRYRLKNVGSYVYADLPCGPTFVGTWSPGKQMVIMPDGEDIEAARMHGANILASY